MTDWEFIQPFIEFINWCRTFKMTLAEHTFTFLEMWTFCILVVVVIWFIDLLLSD